MGLRALVVATLVVTSVLSGAVLVPAGANDVVVESDSADRVAGSAADVTQLDPPRQDPSDPNFSDCYAFAKLQGQLQWVNKTTADTIDVGPPHKADKYRVSDMAFQPGTGVLFGVSSPKQNVKQLATISLDDGTVTLKDEPFGVGQGAFGAVDLSRVEALSFDPTTGVLYAVARRPNGQDVLFQVDPDTGAHVADAFGADVDYVPISAAQGLDDVDALAIQPGTGQMYAIANDPGASDNLLRVNETDGTTQSVGEVGVNNLEGLSFDLHGDLYATSTSAGGAGEGDTLWSVDTDTGTATRIGALPYDKYEALACGLGGPTETGADLSVSKSVDRGVAAPGEQVTFTVTVTNDGPETAENVTLSDALSGDFAVTSAGATHGTYDQSTGTWSVGDLANGATATLVLTASVDPGVPSGTTLSNVAEVSASDQADPDSTPNNGVPEEDDYDVAYVDVVAPSEADLELAKTVDDATPHAGQNVTFTVTVTNRGTSDAGNVSVADVLDPAFTGVEANATAGFYPASDGSWQVGTLPNGSSATLELTVQVPTWATEGDVFQNVAEVQSSDVPDPDSVPGNAVPTEDDYDRATVEVAPRPTADLSLSKTVDDPTPAVGDAVTFTVTLSNDGPDAAERVVVDDALSSGLSLESATPSVGTFDAANGSWFVPQLANGSTATLTLVARVTNDSGPVEQNVVEVTSSEQFDPDSTPGDGEVTDDDYARAIVQPQRSADLELTKSVDRDTVTRGDDVTFTVTVTNTGPHAATGVTVTDRLSNGLSPLSNETTRGSFDGTTGVWTIGRLEAGEEATLRLTWKANVTGSDATLEEAFLNNVAEVQTSDQTDPDSIPGNNVPTEDDYDNASVRVTSIPEPPGPSADLELSKSVGRTTAQAGDTVTYTVTVTNGGPNATTNVTVSDDLPAGFDYVSHSTARGTFDPASETWSVGTLESGESATLTVTTRVSVPPGRYDNVAQVATSDAADPDSTPGNNAPGEDDQDAATVTVTDPAAADLELSKSVDRETMFTEEIATFTVSLTNQGPDAATGVVVGDQMPSGTTYVAHEVTRGTFDPATGLWSLDVQNATTETLTLTVRAETPGTKTNVAEVLASDQRDTDSRPGDGVTRDDDYAEASVAVTDPEPAQVGEISGDVVDENVNSLATTGTQTVRVNLWWWNGTAGEWEAAADAGYARHNSVNTSRFGANQPGHYAFGGVRSGERYKLNVTVIDLVTGTTEWPTGFAQIRDKEAGTSTADIVVQSSRRAILDDRVLFEDQASDGESVIVASVTTLEAGFVVVTDADGTVLGSSRRITEIGVRDVAVSLSPPLATNGELRAQIYHDDGDGEFEVDEDTPVGNVDAAQVSVSGVCVAVAGDGTCAADGTPSGDGLLQDVNGDGTTNVLDVQVLYADLTGPDSVAAENTVFDFNDDGRVTILDVQALFARLTA